MWHCFLSKKLDILQKFVNFFEQIDQIVILYNEFVFVHNLVQYCRRVNDREAELEQFPDATVGVLVRDDADADFRLQLVHIGHDCSAVVRRRKHL